MQLRVSPDELHAAGMALGIVADRLEDAAAGFATEATRDAPDLGADAAPAALRGAAAARQAGEVIVSDIRSLSRALRLLAHEYDAVDSTAVPTPRR